MQDTLRIASKVLSVLNIILKIKKRDKTWKGCQKINENTAFSIKPFLKILVTINHFEDKFKHLPLSVIGRDELKSH